MTETARTSRLSKRAYASPSVKIQLEDDPNAQPQYDCKSEYHLGTPHNTYQSSRVVLDSSLVRKYSGRFSSPLVTLATQSYRIDTKKQSYVCPMGVLPTNDIRHASPASKTPGRPPGGSANRQCGGGGRSQPPCLHLGLCNQCTYGDLPPPFCARTGWARRRAMSKGQYGSRPEIHQSMSAAQPSPRVTEGKSYALVAAP